MEPVMAHLCQRLYCLRPWIDSDAQFHAPSSAKHARNSQHRTFSVQASEEVRYAVFQPVSKSAMTGNELRPLFFSCQALYCRRPCIDSDGQFHSPSSEKDARKRQYRTISVQASEKVRCGLLQPVSKSALTGNELRPLFFFRLAIVGFLLLSVGHSAAAQDTTDPDEEFLVHHQLQRRTGFLHTFLRHRAGLDLTPNQITRLISRLGDEHANNREQAMQELVLLGTVVLPDLQKAVNSPDAEIGLRARNAIRQIQLTWGLPQSAVRWLLRHPGGGTIEALLAFLPFATGNDELTIDIWHGLARLGLRDGRIHKALLTALQDNAAARRAAAGCLVGRWGDRHEKEQARRLLADPDPNTRLRTAQGLLAAHDNAAVPALISLLKDGPLPIAWQAQELLHWAAGPESPGCLIQDGKSDQRLACTSKWLEWWKHQNQVLQSEPTKVNRMRPRLLFVREVGWPNPAAADFVSLIGGAGKVLWQTTIPLHTVDIQMLPNSDLIFSKEVNNHLVLTECDVVPRCISTMKVPFNRRLISWQRLPNGATFIATQFDAVEITSTGDELYHIEFEKRLWSLRSALRLYLNHLLCIWEDTRQNVWIQEIDIETRLEIKRFKLIKNNIWLAFKVNPSSSTQYIVAMRREQAPPPDDSVIADGKLYEYNGTGRQIWERQVSQPREARLLPNGNILVFMGKPPGFLVKEIDRGGKTIWEARPSASNRRLIHLHCLDLIGFGFVD
jgi:hypothetical protein